MYTYLFNLRWGEHNKGTLSKNHHGTCFSEKKNSNFL